MFDYAECGLPPVITVGNSDLNLNEYTEIASANREQMLSLLSIGSNELVQDRCIILSKKDAEDGLGNFFGVGEITITEEMCEGHYTGMPILPLHWGLHSLAQTAVLLIKFLRHSETILPQVVSLDDARGRDYIVPNQRLIHTVRVDRTKRDFIRSFGVSWNNGNPVMECTLGLVLDIQTPQKPDNLSWENILKREDS